MTKCPHCGKELKMSTRVEYYVDNYGKSAIGATECCNKLVEVSQVRQVLFEAYTGNRTEDDWGVSVC